MCVLEAINECYEALCNVHMYVCMCQKVRKKKKKVNQEKFFLSSFYIVLGIPNLEGNQNCMIVSNLTTFLMPFFQKSKNFQRRHVGCLSRGNRLEYCPTHLGFFG